MHSEHVYLYVPAHPALGQEHGVWIRFVHGRVLPFGYGRSGMAGVCLLVILSIADSEHG